MVGEKKYYSVSIEGVTRVKEIKVKLKNLTYSCS